MIIIIIIIKYKSSILHACMHASRAEYVKRGHRRYTCMYPEHNRRMNWIYVLYSALLGTAPVRASGIKHIQPMRRCLE